VEFDVAVASCFAAPTLKMYRAYSITLGGCPIYIGVTQGSVERRWSAHCAKARAGSPLRLHEAIRLYGPQSFRQDWIASARTREDAGLLERRLIVDYGTRFPAGLNSTSGGFGAAFEFTPKHRAILSASHLGKKQSDETKRKIGAASARRRHSSETCAKIAAIQGRRYEDPAYRAANAEHLRAMSKAPAERARRKERFADYMRDPVFLARWIGNTGHAHSATARARMRSSRLKFMAENKLHRELSGKLRAEQVAQIKRRLLAGEKQTEIASVYGVRNTSVSHIARGRTWRDVAPAPAVELPAT
jgi:NUMOD3 motif